MHVIKLDSKCEDARQELIRVRSSQLMVSYQLHIVYAVK